MKESLYKNKYYQYKQTNYTDYKQYKQTQLFQFPHLFR